MVIIDTLHLLTKVLPMTLTGQISYVEKESGVVYSSVYGRINMSISTRKITPTCIPRDAAGYLLISLLLPSLLSGGPSQPQASIISPQLGIIWPKHLRIT